MAVAYKQIRTVTPLSTLKLAAVSKAMPTSGVVWYFDIDIFVNTLSKPCAHCTCNVAYKQVLSDMYCHTVVHAWACSCQQSNAYFEGISLESVPCRFSIISQGCCPSTLLHMTTVVYVEIFFVERISQTVWKFTKFAKLKTHKKFCATVYTETILPRGVAGGKM